MNKLPTTLNNTPGKENITTSKASNTLVERATTVTGRVKKPLHQYNVTQIDFTERKIHSLMTVKQAKQAHVEALRKEIKKAEKAGIAESQIVKLKRILGTKPEASFEEIQYLAKWHEGRGNAFDAIRCYDRILSCSEVSNDEKIFVLKNIIQLAWDKNESEKVTHYCELLLELVSKGSRDEADVFKILSDNYSDKAFLETTIYYCKLFLNHPKTNEEEKERALTVIIDYISVVEDPSTLLRISNSFLSDNQPELGEICLNQTLSINQLSLEDKITALTQLCNIHINNKNWKKAINAYNQLLSSKNNQEDNINILKNIAHCYNKLGDQNTMLKYYEKMLVLDQLNSEKIINLLFDLKDLCIQNENIEKAIECCNKALVIEGINVTDQIYTLKCLSDLYIDKNKKIESLEKILLIHGSSRYERFIARKKLSKLYLEIDNFNKAFEYYKETIKIKFQNEEQLEEDLRAVNLFYSFVTNKNINLNERLNQIQTKDLPLKNQLLETLTYNPGLWHGKYRLTDKQWDNILNKEVLPEEISDLIFLQYITIHETEYNCITDFTQIKVYFNRISFLANNCSSSSWNSLNQRDGIITEQIWNDCINNPNTVLDHFCKIRSEETTDVDNFIVRCSQERDPEEGQLIAKRIIAVIDVLEDYFSQLNNNNSQLSQCEKENIIKIIHGAIDIMTDGGKSCGDGATEALNDVENYLKIFKNPQYKANIFFTMFKLYAIQDKLTDKKHIENLETHLYYLTKFNSLLGLGLCDTTILYDEYAKNLPLEEALSILSEAFTAERLINFTMNSHLFRMIFELDDKIAQEIQPLEIEYLNTSDIKDRNERYEAEIAILAKIDDMKDCFYKQKAAQMYLNAGLLLSKDSKI